MKQTVDILGHQGASIALINAMVAALGPEDHDLRLKFGMEPTGADTKVGVELIVNGVSVPLIETLTDSLRRLNESFDREVREKALELVGAARLDGLRQALDHAEWAIESALSKAQLPE